jgi:regulator of protease activity HflC (stomatin/prohibitin superfamily)
MAQESGLIDDIVYIIKIIICSVYGKIIIAVILLLILLSLLSTILITTTVNFNERIIAIRLGKIRKIYSSGIVFILCPFTVLHRVYVNDVLLNMPKQNALTIDHVNIHIEAFLGYRIVDKESEIVKVLKINNIDEYIKFSTLSIFRALCAQMTMMEIFKSRETLKKQTLDNLNDDLSNYGIKIFKVEINNITTDKEVTDALNAQISTNIEKKNIITKTEAEVESMQLIMKSFDSYTESQILILLAREYIDMLSKNKNNIVMSTCSDVTSMQTLLSGQKIFSKLENNDKNKNAKR